MGLFGRRHEAELRPPGPPSRTSSGSRTWWPRSIASSSASAPRGKRSAHRNLSTEIRVGETTRARRLLCDGTAVASEADSCTRRDDPNGRRRLAGRRSRNGRAGRRSWPLGSPPFETIRRQRRRRASGSRSRSSTSLSSEERAVGAQIGDLERRLVQLVADLDRRATAHCGEQHLALSRLATEEGGVARRSRSAFGPPRATRLPGNCGGGRQCGRRPKPSG